MQLHEYQCILLLCYKTWCLATINTWKNSVFFGCVTKSCNNRHAFWGFKINSLFLHEDTKTEFYFNTKAVHFGFYNIFWQSYSIRMQNEITKMVKKCLAEVLWAWLQSVWLTWLWRTVFHLCVCHCMYTKSWKDDQQLPQWLPSVFSIAAVS